MSDFIRKEDAINAIYDRIKQIGFEENPLILSIRQAVRDIPKEEVNPVRHGKWIPYEFGDYHWHKCSVCGIADQHIIVTIRYVNGEENSTDIEAVRNFCPNCGADMRGGT